MNKELKEDKSIENKDDLDKEGIKTLGKWFKLMKKAREVCIEPNKTYEFECPNCGGRARAGKSSINGHIHLRCDKCNISIMQ